MIIPRRRILDLGLITAAAAAVPSTTAVSAEALKTGASVPRPGDTLVAHDDPAHTPLRPEALRPGSAPILAWPMDPATGAIRNQTRLNQVLVLLLSDPGDEEPPGKVVAFSAICPHAGCLVSEWMAKTGRLHCPCHGSEYDPAKSGAVLAGPSPLPLPALPVRVENGVIQVAGPFSAPPGGHTSRTM